MAAQDLNLNEQIKFLNEKNVSLSYLNKKIKFFFRHS